MADDSTAVSVDIEQAESSSHGHRQLDDIWDHYKKIRLTTEEHDKWHRWYDARCKYCGVRHAGKPVIPFTIWYMHVQHIDMLSHMIDVLADWCASVAAQGCKDAAHCRRCHAV